MTFAAHPYLFILWSLMTAAEFYLAALAFERVRRIYPYFTAMLAWMAFESLALIYIRLTHITDYGYAYYRMDFVAAIFQMCAVAEVFIVLFSPLATVPKTKLFTLGWSVALMIGSASYLNSHWPFGAGDAEAVFYRSVDRTISVSCAIFLAAVLLFAVHFEMPFRSRLRGIAAGLFLMFYTSVLVTVITANVGRSAILTLSFLPMGAHLITLGIWGFHVYRPEVLSAEISRTDLQDLRRLLESMTLAVGNTPTSCGLTVGKRKPQTVTGKEKAKVVGL